MSVCLWQSLFLWMCVAIFSLEVSFIAWWFYFHSHTLPLNANTRKRISDSNTLFFRAVKNRFSSFHFSLMKILDVKTFQKFHNIFSSIANYIVWKSKVTYRYKRPIILIFGKSNLTIAFGLASFISPIAIAIAEGACSDRTNYSWNFCNGKQIKISPESKFDYDIYMILREKTETLTSIKPKR